jgi:hypothetical protein
MGSGCQPGASDSRAYAHATLLERQEEIMKKILVGIILGIGMTLPMGAIALNYNQTAKQIQGIACRNNDAANQCAATIYKFNDGGNTCYVADDYGDNQHDISCVRYAK